MTLITKEGQHYAESLLKKYYKVKLFPPDRKNYLTDLSSSIGPYMGIEGQEQSSFMLDACSQIATLGHGFNASSSFGPAHALESWINDKHSPHFQAILKALTQFIKRKMNREDIFINFCNSGAEANETAIGYCYRRRIHPKANTILAFEGSFHGRMMMTLASTWSPAKREIFEWPGFLTEYCPYPELSDDNIKRVIPEDWCSSWDQASLQSFRPNPSWDKIDKEITSEISSLMAVREKLLSKNIFAFIIEPMQCEGGDRYSSGRFHQALILMARSFGVFSIYDEIQTGFHLGTEFFWHQGLELKRQGLLDITPDYITCAKKAQIGMIISTAFHSHEHDTFQVSSLLRGYYQGLLLDQNNKTIFDIESSVRTYLKKLVAKHSTLITQPRIRGLAFAFDLCDKDKLSHFVEQRFVHGILFYPAGHKTLRFRLNTSFYKEDLEVLFLILDNICTQLTKHKMPTLPQSIPLKRTPPDFFYEWSLFILNIKYQILREQLETNRHDILAFFEKMTGRKLTLLNKDNFSKYQKDIMKLQERVYEPSRITPIDVYKKVVHSPKGYALVVLDQDNITAMSFASLLSEHSLERGVRQDPFFDLPEAIYCIDTTVNPNFRSEKLGFSIKYALQALASIEGVLRLQGRNREVLASSMLKVNCSLGGHELQYLKENYPDFQKHRDMIYYTTQLSWQREPINLSRAIDAPLSSDDLNPDYIKEQLPCLSNKVCLSNFASKRFLDIFKTVLSLMPKSLHHGYSTSGQSECVDKIAKSLWFNSNKKVYRMLTFQGHYFGAGSLLSQSLSSSCDPFFHVDHIDTPTQENYKDILDSVKQSFKEHEYLGLWIEPLTQQSMVECPREFLLALKKLCLDNKVKLIYNETASGSYRYSEKHFFASNDSKITPDAAMVFTGGTSGIVAITEESFIQKPMMLISTWDGDEFALSNYHRAVCQIEKEKKDFLKMTKEFEKTLSSFLDRLGHADFTLHKGRGLIRGSLPQQYARYFDQTPQGHYLICPGYSSMKRFVQEFV